MDDKKIRLNILGISYSQTQTGSYALILEEESGERRLPIIIGNMEAQSIAIHLEGLQPSRPLTHDLFTSVLASFNVAVVEVNITKLDEGVFYSELTCENNSTRIVIDARTSDAIALALRFKCPVYTRNSILQKAGIRIGQTESTKKAKEEPVVEIPTPVDENPLGKLSDKELQEELGKAIGAENYEYASKIRDEIQRREQA